MADNYIFKEKESEHFENSTLQYFTGSIIEKLDEIGATHNELRLFSETEGEPDLELPKESFLHELKPLESDLKEFQSMEEKDIKIHQRAKMLFCITMYMENWSQILQSIAGCIRCILELHQEGM